MFVIVLSLTSKQILGSFNIEGEMSSLPLRGRQEILCRHPLLISVWLKLFNILRHCGDLTYVIKFLLRYE